MEVVFLCQVAIPELPIFFILLLIALVVHLVSRSDRQAPSDITKAKDIIKISKILIKDVEVDQVSPTALMAKVQALRPKKKQ